MEFYSINTKKDIDFLMDKFVYFHDSCIKELKYISGSYVAVNRAMNPFNHKRQVSIIFQSQMSEIPVIEMVFDAIVQLNLQPTIGSYDSIIYDASLVKINNLFYWSEWPNFRLADMKKEEGTWIIAEKVRWRALDNALGDNQIYK